MILFGDEAFGHEKVTGVRVLIRVGMCVLVAQSCLTLCDPMDCSLPGSTVHGISQQKYWSGLLSPPPGIFPTQGLNRVSCIAGRVLAKILSQALRQQESLRVGVAALIRKNTRELDLSFALPCEHTVRSSPLPARKGALSTA